MDKPTTLKIVNYMSHLCKQASWMAKSLTSRSYFFVSVEQEEETGSRTSLKISSELHVVSDYARGPRETRCFQCYESKKIDGMEFASLVLGVEREAQRDEGCAASKP